MRFKKHSLRRLLWLLAALVIVCLFSLLVKKLVGSVNSWLMPAAGPQVSLTRDEPLAAEIIFNNEFRTTVFSTEIIKDIDQAQKSLEIAVYSLNFSALKEAIYRANSRGVKVTLILDARKQPAHDQIFSDLPRSIKRFDLGKDTSGQSILMHHKFALIDRGQPQAKLIFGSYNWTELQERYDPSFLMVSSDKDLIASFGREFDRLAKKEAGPDKLHDKQYNPWDLDLTAGGNKYEIWFSPGPMGKNFNSRILKMIKSAQKDIKIMIWDFTDQNLADELIRRAQAGVKVTIITDDASFYKPSSVFIDLKAAKDKFNLANLELLTDAPRSQEAQSLVPVSGEESIEPFLHYHLLIVDDRQALFGTNNWSRAGSYFNDEALIVTDDLRIINQLSESFRVNYQKNIR